MTVLVDPQSATEKELRERVSAVCSAFEEQKGTLSFTSRRDPLANLVETVLSHNTNDRNRDIAFRALRLKYPTWEEVHHAAREELELVIRPAGLNRQKAERIQRLLEYLKTKYGDYTVDFLDTMSFDDAFLELGHLKGIGYKTLAVVMSFSLGVDVFPVDTHVHRLCRRIGFVPWNFDAVKTFHAMRSLVPVGKSYQFHLHLIGHGREICHARKAKCDECFVSHLCRFASDDKGARQAERP